MRPIHFSQTCPLVMSSNMLPFTCVMLGDDGMVRICDFGVSFKCKNNSHLTKQVGSMMYMAPEILYLCI